MILHFFKSMLQVFAFAKYSELPKGTNVSQFESSISFVSFCCGAKEETKVLCKSIEKIYCEEVNALFNTQRLKKLELFGE